MKNHVYRENLTRIESVVFEKTAIPRFKQQQQSPENSNPPNSVMVAFDALADNLSKMGLHASIFVIFSSNMLEIKR